jgi:hypothetical protein
LQLGVSKRAQRPHPDVKYSSMVLIFGGMAVSGAFFVVICKTP